MALNRLELFWLQTLAPGGPFHPDPPLLAAPLTAVLVTVMGACRLHQLNDNPTLNSGCPSSHRIFSPGETLLNPSNPQWSTFMGLVFIP